MHKVTLILFLMSVLVYTNAQSTISGKVTDSRNNPISGVDILIVNTGKHATTGKNGYFTLTSNLEKGKVQFRHISYITKTIPFNNSIDFENIKLTNKDNNLKEIIITGNTDYAIERQTPVSSSIMRSTNILQTISNKSIPEILNRTPSVYATKSGGGFGDTRINIRGFAQDRIAILLNGIPLNDMENSGMYWSNILGLENVLSAIQVQRGLGYSKLALSSIGGTVNLITSPSDKAKGSKITIGYGNNNSKNIQVNYNSGLLKNGLSLSLNLGKQYGDGYIKGTKYEAYNYFFNIGWKNTKHSLQLIAFGSPQNHGQRAYSYYNMATIEQYLKHGYDYNYNFGYLDGKGYNWYENYYHKSIASLNWDYNINPKTTLSTNIYTSFGRGGGTSDLGRLPGNKFASSGIFRDTVGLVRFDDIVTYNRGGEVVFSDNKHYKRTEPEDGVYLNSFKNNGLTRRAFTNSHTWAGAIINLKRKVSKAISLNAGLDLRESRGTNYIRINNLLGADGYFDFFDKNNPNKIVTKTYKTDVSSVLNVFHNPDGDEKIFFHADGLVNWTGAFGGISYKTDNLFSFIQLAVSNRGFKRIDHFNYLTNDPAGKSDWVNVKGGNIKTGININLNRKNNIYTNFAYFSKQPGFNVIFLDHNNNINKDYKNEKVFGFELGYSYKTEKTSVKANIYNTIWRNRFIQIDYKNADSRGKAKILNLGQKHIGFELEAQHAFNKKIELRTMFSIGDWRYANNVTAKAFDNAHKYTGDVTLNLKDVKVPDAAQLTAHIELTYKPVSGLHLKLRQFFADNLYAAIAPDDNWAGYDKALKLPAYSLTDLYGSYSITARNSFLKKINFSINIDNIFDIKYIAESSTNYQKSEIAADNWRGINMNNKVFFGFGRTYHLSVDFTF